MSYDSIEILARNIATDQFPHNVYRGHPKAFAFDHIALHITTAMIDNGMHEQLGFVERMFAYMPLQHAEDHGMLSLSVSMCVQLAQVADVPVFQAGALEAVEFAKLHQQIIEQFGRFPHRNEILARTSTPEEIAYLNSGAETFGQVKA